jgi:hypothetical protein
MPPAADEQLEIGYPLAAVKAVTEAEDSRLGSGCKRLGQMTFELHPQPRLRRVRLIPFT